MFVLEHKVEEGKKNTRRYQPQGEIFELNNYYSKRTHS